VSVKDFPIAFRHSFAGFLSVVFMVVFASAAQLDTRGILPGPRGLIHLDIEGAREMQMLPILMPLLETVWAELAGSREELAVWRTQAGLEWTRDVDDLTLGIFPAHVAGANLPFVVIARGRFSPEKIHAFAQRHRYSVHRSQGHTVVAVAQGALCARDEHTLLLTDASALTLPRVFAALENRSHSFTSPAQLDDVGAHVGVPFLLAMLDGGLVPRRDLVRGTWGWPVNLPLPEQIFAAFGVCGGVVCLRIEGGFASREKAYELHAYLQMVHSYWQRKSRMAKVRDSDVAVAQANEEKAFARRLLRKLNFVTVDKKIRLELQLNFADFTRLADWLLETFSRHNAPGAPTPAPVN
jgi:hypothetical protein